MKSYLAILAGVMALAFSGCATPFRAPADVAHIQLGRVDSPNVVVQKIWLERKHGALVVRGYVFRQIDAETTSGTHLDVTLYDTAGHVLRRTIEYFEPQEIRRRGSRLTFAAYRVQLDLLPAGTDRIEVKAHDAPPDAH